MDIQKHQRYSRNSMPNVLLTVLRTHPAMTDHWLCRLSVQPPTADSNHITDGYIHQKDIEAEWTLVYSPEAKETPADGGSPAGDS